MGSCMKNIPTAAPLLFTFSGLLPMACPLFAAESRKANCFVPYGDGLVQDFHLFPFQTIIFYNILIKNSIFIRFTFKILYAKICQKDETKIGAV